MACIENQIWDITGKCDSVRPKYWNRSHRWSGISVHKYLTTFKLIVSASSTCNSFQVRSRCCHIAFSSNVRYACRFSQDAAHLVLRRVSKVCCEQMCRKRVCNCVSAIGPWRVLYIDLECCVFFFLDSIDKVSKVTSPVLVIHGTEDEVIDFSHGLAIHDKCPKAVEPLWVEVFDLLYFHLFSVD